MRPCCGAARSRPRSSTTSTPRVRVRVRLRLRVRVRVRVRVTVRVRVRVRIRVRVRASGIYGAGTDAAACGARTIALGSPAEAGALLTTASPFGLASQLGWSGGCP
jgi:hypothetical protein